MLLKSLFAIIDQPNTFRVCLFDWDIDRLGVAAILETKNMLEHHLTLCQEPPSEGYCDRNAEGGESSESHFKLAIWSRLNIHIVHTEGRIQSKSNLFYQPVLTNLDAFKFDKHGPSVTIIGSFRILGRNNLVSIAVSKPNVHEVI